MKYLFRLRKLLLYVAVIVLVSPGDACAYLDPSTGSYVLQVAIAAILGALFAVKSCWNDIKNSFAKIFGKHVK